MEHITDEQLCSFYFQFNFDKTNLCKQARLLYLGKKKKKGQAPKKKNIVSDNAALAQNSWLLLRPDGDSYL